VSEVKVKNKDMSVPENYELVKTKWEAFEQKRFPLGNRSVQCGGQSITALHSEVAGFIIAYLQTSGSLGSRQRLTLQKATQDLGVIVNNVVDSDAADSGLTDEGKEFFTELCEIAKLVLESAHDQPV
jgi:hypothetical protein